MQRRLADTSRTNFDEALIAQHHRIDAAIVEKIVELRSIITRMKALSGSKAAA
jgi:hypothetical protein